MKRLLAPRHDKETLSASYARKGRVAIPDVLDPEVAVAVHRAMCDWTRWALVTRIAGKHRDFDAAEMARMDMAKRAQFDALVGQEARKGFQYLYERWPLYDPDYDVPLDVPALEGIRQMLRGGEFIQLARDVTGVGRIDFADGQLTRYRHGHFLTEHDDEADGKQRIAAYVLGMTPNWRPDFGGQLQFLDAHGGVDEAFVPGFNTLYVFSVPQLHHVSMLASFVDASRLSVTGWLRHG